MKLKLFLLNSFVFQLVLGLHNAVASNIVLTSHTVGEYVMDGERYAFGSSQKESFDLNFPIHFKIVDSLAAQFSPQEKDSLARFFATQALSVAHEFNGKKFYAFKEFSKAKIKKINDTCIAQYIYSGMLCKSGYSFNDMVMGILVQYPQVCESSEQLVHVICKQSVKMKYNVATNECQLLCMQYSFANQRGVKVVHTIPLCDKDGKQIIGSLNQAHGRVQPR